MHNIKNKKIAIVGGGPGGLTLARLLQMNGADVKVYERDAHKAARPKGATLDLHEESGLKALQKAGLMDAFRANYRPGADKLRIVDKYATVLFDDDTDSKGETDRPEIDRGPLQEILLDSLKPDTVVWNSQFSSLTENNNSVNLEFKNGASVFADLLIGADGANSKIRPFVTTLKPFYSGNTVVEGAVYHSETASPKIHKLLNGGKIFAFGDSKGLIVSSKGDGSLVFYTGCNKEEDWTRESGIDFSNKLQVTEWFKKEFDGWNTVWLELFENATGPFVPRPQYCMPLDKEWETLPNLTLIGDAAHVMPPYAGEGVNMAMLDALELSECLLNEKFTDVQSALADYEHKMHVRFAEVGKQTMENTQSMHSPNALSDMLNFFNGMEDQQNSR